MCVFFFVVAYILNTTNYQIVSLMHFICISFISTQSHSTFQGSHDFKQIVKRCVCAQTLSHLATKLSYCLHQSLIHSPPFEQKQKKKKKKVRSVNVLRELIAFFLPIQAKTGKFLVVCVFCFVLFFFSNKLYRAFYSLTCVLIYFYLFYSSFVLLSLSILFSWFLFPFFTYFSFDW